MPTRPTIQRSIEYLAFISVHSRNFTLCGRNSSDPFFDDTVPDRLDVKIHYCGFDFPCKIRSNTLSFQTSKEKRVCYADVRTWRCYSQTRRLLCLTGQIIFDP